MTRQLDARILFCVFICLAGITIKAACDEQVTRYVIPSSPPLLACDIVERTQSTPLAILSTGRLCYSPSPAQLSESPAPEENQPAPHKLPLYKSLSILSISDHAIKTQKTASDLDRLEVVYGPMFAGKGEWLLNKAAEFAKGSDNPLIIAFIHGFIGARQGEIILSRSKAVQPCTAKSVLTAAKFYAKTKKIVRSTAPTRRIGLFSDESQFFSKTEKPNLTDTIIKLNRKYPTMQFFIGGLDTSFTGEGFGCMPDLIRMAKSTVQLRAFCQICQGGIKGKLEGQEPLATMTQRLFNEKPARKSDPLVIPEGSKDNVVYEPRCKKCWQAPE